MISMDDNYTFLIVDDEPEIVDFICDILTDAFGCKILRAKDGLEGYELAKKHKLDLIFSDYRMPLMDGGAMIMAIRERCEENRNVPVLMVSAYIADAKNNAMPHERILFLDKPIEKKALIRNARFALAMN